MSAKGQAVTYVRSIAATRQGMPLPFEAAHRGGVRCATLLGGVVGQVSEPVPTNPKSVPARRLTAAGDTA